MIPITDEQFELVNGWDFEDDATRYLIRTGGWALKDTGGVSQEEWAGVITLGTIGGADQAYFEQVAAAAATNFQLTGPVNQAVKVYGDASHGNFDRRSFLKVFCRIQGKSYAAAALTDIGVSTMTYQCYRFPLANASDIKITHTDAQIIGATPYFGAATKDQSDGSTTVNDPVFTAVAATFAAGDVGKFICIPSGPCAGAYKISTYTDAQHVTCNRNFPSTQSNMAFKLNPEGMKVEWFATAQQRDIGGTNRDFHVIVTGNSGTAEQIYEFIQYLLRQAYDIDVGSGTKLGNVANALLRFVGDTLYTIQAAEGGVFIDGYQAGDINRLVFVDDTGTERTFPYTAALIINFGDNLKNDANAKYWIFFSNNYDSASALMVKDASNADMTADVNGNSQVQRTFAYDSNNQGGRTPGTEAPITAVAIGLSTGQFVKATGLIQRSIANSISLVAALERNYQNPA
jgi:hypothetical protein